MVGDINIYGILHYWLRFLSVFSQCYSEADGSSRYKSYSKQNRHCCDSHRHCYSVLYRLVNFIMINLTNNNLADFLSKPFCLVLVDAEWNNHKDLARRFREIAETYPYDDFAFAELDADKEPELARKFEVRNVPAICYICHGRPIKTVIGDNQDINGHICENGWL